MLTLLTIAVTLQVALAAERKTVDGLEFTINQKDFKPKKFNMFGAEYDDTYGFVSKDFLPLDNRGYAELMEECDFEADSKPLYEYSPLSTAIYYKTTDDYDTFSGYDMVPENRGNYIKGETLDTRLRDGRVFTNNTVMMKICRIAADGGAWHVQRVGPFTSTGGYDWWSIGFPDVGLLSEALEKHPEGVDITRNAFNPILADGTRLSYPPIHTHHSHTIPQPGVRHRLQERPVCVSRTGLGIPMLDNMVREAGCCNLTLFLEQHGDYVCKPEDDGLDCLMQGDKSVRRVLQAIDYEGELNDVRPTGSAPLEWWYQIAVKWTPMDASVIPISQVTMVGPGAMFPPSQSTKSGTAKAPKLTESVILYSGPLHITGDLQRCKVHAHSAIFDSQMLLVGTYEDFGLDKPQFTPPLSYEFIPTPSLGFKDNQEVGHYILGHMEKSQLRYDYKCVDKHDPNNAVCSRPRPDWVCGAVRDYAVTEYGGKDYVFDRRPKTWAKPWSFKEGDPIVGVGLARFVDQPPNPSYPDSVPDFLQQHTVFFLYYTNDGRGHSAQSGVIYTHWGLFVEFASQNTPAMVLAIMTSIILWKGPPNSASGLLVVFQYMWALILASLVLAILVGSISCCGYVIYRSKESMAPQPVKYSSLKTEEDEDLEL
mmetsp:Transcript_29169/g.62841  ORF Transcript_29169/g.62841 Transcript_29169/m.62841 type:complete len:651 (+) Transcript_29169:210-2162(+)